MMKRAAILIGIDKTGDLPPLKDAARGALAMKKWADAQGMNPVHVFTDQKKNVDVDSIWDAIKTLVNAANLHQLVIYFAGHGINLNRQEYWLLSDAPDDTKAAVNVAGSVALASTCGIPHIVLISDACRTAAEGIRAQSVSGREIFPNREDSEKPVDQFFACELGRPSHEIRDPKITISKFKALYTGELLPALLGKRSQIVEWATKGAENTGLIRPRSLRDYMSVAMTKRLDSLGPETGVIQVPTARINSDPNAWISLVSREKPKGLGSHSRGRPKGSGGDPGKGSKEPLKPIKLPMTSETISSLILESVLTPRSNPKADFEHSQTEFEVVRTLPIQIVRDFIGSTELIAKPFGPTHHETQCGFKIRGTRIIEAFSRNANAYVGDYDGLPGAVVRVDPKAWPGESVLLVLEGNTGVLLPAIPGFLAALTIEDGELVDVAYEPSENTPRWYNFTEHAAEIRALRAIASASMTRGVFRLEANDALAIAKRMQYVKDVDPALAVYAAYAYHDLQRLDLIREMKQYMRDSLGATLFDVALLSRELNGRRVTAETNILSFVPLLAQGWALLSANKVSLPPALAELQRTLVPSLWTMFNQQGIELVRSSFTSGEII